MLRQLYFLSLAVPRVLSERRAKVLKRNRLVACHTNLVLIINVDINIFMPDIGMRHIHSVSCLSIGPILVYTKDNTLHAQIHVRYNLAN